MSVCRSCVIHVFFGDDLARDTAFGRSYVEAGVVCCRNSEAEVQGVNVELGAALEHLFHHKLHIQQTLEQAHKHVEDVHKDMLAVAC